MNRARTWVTAVLLGAAAAGMAAAAGAQTKPLTNDDVAAMVKGGLPESVVIATIQASPQNFDLSPAALIRLHQAGATADELKAMAQAAAPAPAAANADPAPRAAMPTVAVAQAGGTQVLALEKTQLIQTKTKPTSMTTLAGDSVVSQAIQTGVGDASTSAAAHISSGMGSTAVQQAGGIVSGMFAHRTPTVTYVWGVTGTTSANVLASSTPAFAVDFSRAPGVKPEEFVPEIVKLTPAQNTCRLVGATRGREDEGDNNVADWAIYSNFLEEPVAVQLQKAGPGQYRMSPQTALLPGEYAVVLRPTTRNKQFSGGDVARDQGEGLMFDSVWSFQVAPEAHPQNQNP